MERERDQLEAEKKKFEEYKKQFRLELMMERKAGEYQKAKNKFEKN